MHTRLSTGFVAVMIVLALLVPVFVHAQSESESRIASLITQIISLQKQLLELLSQNPSTSNSLPNFPLPDILTPTLQSPGGFTLGGGSVSDRILNTIGPVIRPEESYIDQDLILPTATVATPVQTGPTCSYYGDAYPEGSTRAGSACPGFSCPDIAGPVLTCRGGEWRYATGESVCTPPGFILDTPDQCMYREGLGCRAATNIGISCSDARYPCAFRSGVTGTLTCVAKTVQGSCPTVQTF